ncbi:MAG: phospholipase D-like domain-containing protein [Candidatus Woesearchaeota archaeon]
MKSCWKRTILYASLILGYLFFLFLTTGTFSTQAHETSFVDNGSTHFFSCSDHDCAYLLNTLLNNSREARCAFYDIDTSIITLPAHAKTLIYDENFNTASGSGSEPVGSNGLMHHKFCIFDNRTVLTGTWNPTYRGTYVNDNAIILLQSDVIAKLYNREYTRLEQRTGEQKGTNIHAKETYRINLSGRQINLCFSPVQDCERMLITQLENSQNTIRILAFMFTSDAVGEALERLSSNIKIQGVFEATGVSRYSEFDTLVKAGADIIRDGNPGFMHEKMMIIDNKTILIGSYNPTKNARKRNDENLLAITDQTVARDALKEYDRIVLEAQANQ